MPIEFRCPCGRLLRVDDAHAGQQGTCPACGNLLDIPGAVPQTNVIGLSPPPDAAGLTTAPAVAPGQVPGVDGFPEVLPPVPELARPTYRLSSAGDVLAGSFLFGPLGGVALIAWNYLVLRRFRAFALVLLAGLVLAAGVSVLALSATEDAGRFGLSFGFSLLGCVTLPAVAWLLQGRVYDDHLARGGQKGSGWRVLGLGICGAAAWLGVFIAVAIAMAIASESEPAVKTLQVTEVETVYYSRDLPEADARQLGSVLTQLGLFTGEGRKSVRLTRDGDGLRVWIVLRDRHDDPKLVSYFTTVRERLATQAFPGRSVELVLCDDHLVVKRSIR
jgi:hypothetical protein